MEEDFTNVVIVAPKGSDGHDIIIVERWKPELYKDRWFWKCVNCYESSGVLSTADILKLKNKGLLYQHDGEIKFDKQHPKDQTYSYSDYYDQMYWSE